MCSRLISLAVPGSLKSFFACFGVLRRSATHDARAHTPIASLCGVRRACERDVLSSEVKRSEASHERDNHRVRCPCGRHRRPGFAGLCVEAQVRNKRRLAKKTAQLRRLLVIVISRLPNQSAVLVDGQFFGCAGVEFEHECNRFDRRDRSQR